MKYVLTRKFTVPGETVLAMSMKPSGVIENSVPSTTSNLMSGLYPYKNRNPAVYTRNIMIMDVIYEI